MTNPVNWSNACERAAALSAAYYGLLSGQQEVEIRTRTLDAEEMVRFSKADLNVLRNEMRAAEAQCARSQGLRNPNGRFAIGCSYRPARRYPGYDPSDPQG